MKSLSAVVSKLNPSPNPTSGAPKHFPQCPFSLLYAYRGPSSYPGRGVGVVPSPTTVPGSPGGLPGAPPESTGGSPPTNPAYAGYSAMSYPGPYPIPYGGPGYMYPPQMMPNMMVMVPAYQQYPPYGEGYANGPGNQKRYSIPPGRNPNQQNSNNNPNQQQGFRNNTGNGSRVFNQGQQRNPNQRMGYQRSNSDAGTNEQRSETETAGDTVRRSETNPPQSNVESPIEGANRESKEPVDEGTPPINRSSKSKQPAYSAVKSTTSQPLSGGGTAPAAATTTGDTRPSTKKPLEKGSPKKQVVEKKAPAALPEFNLEADFPSLVNVS